jgi:hypothetical protein
MRIAGRPPKRTFKGVATAQLVGGLLRRPSDDRAVDLERVLEAEIDELCVRLG